MSVLPTRHWVYIGRFRVRRHRTLFGREFLVLQVEIGFPVPPRPGAPRDEPLTLIAGSTRWRNATIDDLPYCAGLTEIYGLPGYSRADGKPTRDEPIRF